MDEHRAVQRHRVLKTGTIEFGGSTISCTVRNKSDAGAMLQVASQTIVPYQFTLALPADGSRRRCHVVWRKDKRIGVTFWQSE